MNTRDGTVQMPRAGRTDTQMLSRDNCPCDSLIPESPVDSPESRESRRQPEASKAWRHRRFPTPKNNPALSRSPWPPSKDNISDDNWDPPIIHRNTPQRLLLDYTSCPISRSFHFGFVLKLVSVYEDNAPGLSDNDMLEKHKGQEKRSACPNLPRWAPSHSLCLFQSMLVTPKENPPVSYSSRILIVTMYAASKRHRKQNNELFTQLKANWSVMLY
jgi:hypothetical protein